MGINPTFKVSNAKVSPTKAYIKSNSPTKAVSLVKVSSFINKSGADKILFIFKEESSTKSPIKSGSTTKKTGSIKFSRLNKKKAKSVLLKQDTLKPVTKRLTTVFPPIRLSATPPIIIDDILKAFKFIKFSIDFNNLDF